MTAVGMTIAPIHNHDAKPAATAVYGVVTASVDPIPNIDHTPTI